MPVSTRRSTKSRSDYGFVEPETGHECSVVEVDMTGRRPPRKLHSTVHRTPLTEWSSGSIMWLKSAVLTTFMPVGYPDSVSHEYVTYQGWDTLQALCSYLRGIVATTQMLGGLGVGSAEATPLAAAVQWVLRDGAGMLGGLLFASGYSAYFDRDLKLWRLFADVINDLGLTLDMLAPLAGQEYFLYVISIASVCKSMCGVAAGATKAAITSHFALRDNMADLQCKEGSQETLVTLVGLVAGIYAAQVFDTSQMWAWFLLLTAVHIYANWRGVCCLELKTLNQTRAKILVDRFLNAAPISVQDVAAVEPVLPSLWNAAVVHMGAKWDQAHHPAHQVLSRQDKFMISRSDTGDAFVILHPQADARDELEAFVQAHLLCSTQEVHAANQSRMQFDTFVTAIVAQGWRIDPLCLGTSQWRYKYVPQ